MWLLRACRRRCARCCRMVAGGLGKSAVDADSHFGSFGGSSSRQGFAPLVETTLGRMDAFGRAVRQDPHVLLCWVCCWVCCCKSLTSAVQLFANSLRLARRLC